MLHSISHEENMNEITMIYNFTPIRMETWESSYTAGGDVHNATILENGLEVSKHIEHKFTV